MSELPSDFIKKISNAENVIASAKITISDLLTTGSAIAGQQTNVHSDVSRINTELNAKVKTITEDIKKQEGIISRSERDFMDVRETLPETIPTPRFQFLEDYTMVFLMVSYLFMIAIAVHTYVFHYNGNWIVALLKGGFYSMILTFLFGMILYNVC
jgi:hypothetical protein